MLTAPAAARCRPGSLPHLFVLCGADVRQLLLQAGIPDMSMINSLRSAPHETL